ncbi:MAG: DUF2326 domain-containing protein [Pedobacter sp.]|jgi:uncharacterized protein YydD (DUF2326 family)
MLKLIKLYSDDGAFKEVSFNAGINLICGEKSINPDGTISSRKQNGVGKSLVIELINFCLLKGSYYSRVPSVNDEYLHKDSYVNLHFRFNDKDFIFSRNKRGKIRIKEDGEDFIEYSFDDAKEILNKILGFTNTPISARDYISFMIKEEDYSYKKFAEFYKANYSDLLKIHFYFFDLPVEVLGGIKKAFEEYSVAQGAIRKLNQELSAKDLDIKKLRAIQNQFETEVKSIEGELSYSEAVENLQSSNSDINKEEQELNKLIMQKKQQELQLLEVSDLTSFFGEDFYVDDEDLKLVYNKYKQGLGDFIKKDLEELKQFRNQVVEFKNELLKEKKSALEIELVALQKQIDEKQDRISKNYKIMLDTTSNNMVKNFQLFKDKFSQLEDHTSNIKMFDRQEKIKEESKTVFTELVAKISKRKAEIQKIEESFKKTFTGIHQAIMGSSECDFSFNAKNIFKAKSYFQFNIYIQGQGSKGVNQMQSVIYDLSILENEYTTKNNLGCIIHDNLIFGSVDKDSSIKTLNYLNGLNPATFQYIATVNKDDFNYEELKEEFSFDPSKNVVIELTRQDPLFPNWKS